MNDLNAGGYVFVCGATSMGVDVLDAMATVVAAQKGIAKPAAVDFIKKLQSTGRYVQELWS